MGSSPVPFFPTTMVPPPPCGCGAPLYAPCSFSPAATYPPTPFPGGYYPSPFPFYGVPSAFPYAASYPHPHPPLATSYTAATDSSPASAYDLSTLPSTANSYPTAFSSFPSVSSYQNHQATIPNQIGLKEQPEATSLPTPAMPESTAWLLSRTGA
nr:leucine-rich repeat extensin-like protein 5 [Lolium perenne]